MTRHRPLTPDRLYTACDQDNLAFATTADLEPLEEVEGQDRAMEALRFAVGMKHKGFNLFALGPEGTGKYSRIRRFLERRAAEEPVPDDWCYVNDFDKPHRPRALRLPPGRGRDLRGDMDRLVDDLNGAIPAAFESEEYRTRKGVIEEKFKEFHEETLGALQRKAQEHDVVLIRTPVGLAVAPVRDGEVLSSQEFEDLSDGEKSTRRAALEELQKDLEEVLHRIPRWEKEQREELKTLNREVTRYAVGHLIDELAARWADLAEVIRFLEGVREDVVDNVDDFLPHERPSESEAMTLPAMRRLMGRMSHTMRYKVNVLVDNGTQVDGEAVDESGTPTVRGAPVVFEDHPTQANLIGRIEHMSQMGTLVTDFNLIKGGALHKANGGYLILDARMMLRQPFAWETLTRALRAHRIRIESPLEAMGWAGTVTLDPEPVPLDVKVVLVGEPWLYYLLSYHDPDFRDLFKVAADFDDRMDRTEDNALQYARIISALVAKENLRHVDRGGVARMVEYGARLADDAEKLTTHMGSIVDLAREADFWARDAGASVVSAAHVQRAIDAKIRRSDRLRERIQEEIHRGTLRIDTEGLLVGEINGLAVVQLDHFSFGKPDRISCQVRMGKGEVVDIEREVDLGGPIHSKGVLIMASFLGTRFAKDRPLTLSATLVFEQSYGGVEGDSASSTELYAILSALSEIPIKQSIAVTGSVDQKGRVQAIGGVNEKIEGFFDICRSRGLTGEHGVIIPRANIKHLMLRADVVDAVRQGKFSVWAVDTVDQGIEILTGVPAGRPDDRGEYPIGTVNRAVAHRLADFARKAHVSPFEERARYRGLGYGVRSGGGDAGDADDRDGGA